METLKRAVKEKQFAINPKTPKKSAPTMVDYDKLIAVEERRLARAKEAYLAEIDTIEQYKQNKAEITKRIEEIESKRDNEASQEIDVNAFKNKVTTVLELIEREDVTESAKNEALRTIIEKIVFQKAEGNLAISFHEI